MPEEIKILNLADVPEYMEEVSRWLWLEWAKADGYSLEEIVYRTRYASQRDTVPQMLVAVIGDKPVWCPCGSTTPRPDRTCHPGWLPCM